MKTKYTLLTINLNITSDSTYLFQFKNKKNKKQCESEKARDCSVVTLPFCFMEKDGNMSCFFVFCLCAMKHVRVQFPDQVLNLSPLQQKHGIFTAGLPGKYPSTFFNIFSPPQAISKVNFIQDNQYAIESYFGVVFPQP